MSAAAATALHLLLLLQRLPLAIVLDPHVGRLFRQNDDYRLSITIVVDNRR